jgi:DNA polymerase-3 subunit beta
MPPSTREQAEFGMEITIERSDLLKELSATQGIVERKVSIPILSSFLLEAAENRVMITGTDLDFSLRTSCPAQVKIPGACTLPARKLYDYVRLLGDGELKIKLLENHWVQIRSGRSNTKMVGLPCENFPVLPFFPPDSAIHLPAPVLRTLISKTIFSISQEETRYTLSGALLVLRPEGIAMVSTDGHRMAYIEALNCAVSVAEEIKVLIPKKAMAAINSLLSATDIETFDFAKDESSLFFRIGSRLLTARQLTGQFPNYETVLPRSLDKNVTVSADELKGAILRVSQFADERSNAIRFKMDNNQIKIYSSSSETGESEDTVETSYAGDPLSIAFNSRYLLDFLKVAGQGDVKFDFKAADQPGEFRPDDSTDTEYKYRYIVMPLRV